jgi:poly(3-hydroxybutyrate) depolymerase
MADDIKLVYTGSEVEAMYVEELLKENGIGSTRRDNLRSSVIAGWGHGWPESSNQIFVETENYLRAKKILDDYFSSEGKNDED